MRIVISIPMEKNRDSHFCKNRAALVSTVNISDFLGENCTSLMFSLTYLFYSVDEPNH